MLTHIHTRKSWIALLAAGLWTTGAVAGTGEHVIAVSLDQAPGANGMFIALMPPALNTTGDVAFDALTDSFTTPNGIWSDRSGALELVVGAGDAAPDTESGTVFDAIALEGFNDAGHVALSALLSGPNVIPFDNDFGIWVETDNGLELVVRLGMLTGLGPGVFFEEINPPIAFNDNDQIAFTARVTGDSAWSVWVASPGLRTLAARAGLAAPGISGATFDEIISADPATGTDPVLNDTGQVMIHATVTGPGVDSSNDQGIWLGKPGQLFLLAREGDSVPEMPDHLFTGFVPTDPLALNDTAQAAFVALIANQNGGLEGNGTYLVAGGPTDLNPLARVPVLLSPAGPLDHPPGTSSGTMWSAFGNFCISAAGKIAFEGFIDGKDVDPTNNSGVWSTRTGTMFLLAREGETPIDCPATHEFQTFQNVCMNAPGRNALLAEGGEPFSGDRGVWTDEDTGLLARLRPGDTIEIQPGDNATVMNISAGRVTAWVGGEDGRPRWYNDDRQAAVLASLLDGRDAIVVHGGDGGAVCTGDLTGDGLVDVFDLFDLLAGWGTNGSGADIAEPDNIIDVFDLFGLLAAWGNCP